MYLIKRDLDAFRTHFKNLESSCNCDDFCLFNKDDDAREATYMISFHQYQRCSSSMWQHWKKVLVREHTKIQHATYPISCERHSDHIWLDPYFLDNRSLVRIGLLDSNKAKEDKDRPFAYSSDFYEHGIRWHEDVWSKRLCHCIRDNIVDENKLHIEFTGKNGNDICKDKNAMVYRFHGAPDLKQKIYDQCVVMNITTPSTSDTTAASECTTPYVNHPDAEIY